MPKIELHHGDCTEIMRRLPDASIDAVITDPPYPEISREYGRMSEADWWDMMMGVCTETRRVLKPIGSAVFILQPNSRKVGSMRGWLWEFMAWVCRDWNMVQDVWWWNITAPTNGVCSPRERGLMRQSIKACVWAGGSNCHRVQDNVLWTESYWNTTHRLRKRWGRDEAPSGNGTNKPKHAAVAAERGGVIPFNVLPISNHHTGGNQKSNGHSASTPLELAKWWTRYIVPPGGTVLDPFVGSGTMMLAALKYGCNGIGIDKTEKYVEIARQRTSTEQEQLSLWHAE